MTTQYEKPNINNPGFARFVSSSGDITTDDTVVTIIGGAPALRLPFATTVPGLSLVIKSATGSGTVTARAGESIDGSASFAFSSVNQTLEVIADGSVWRIVDVYIAGAGTVTLQDAVQNTGASTAILGGTSGPTSFTMQLQDGNEFAISEPAGGFDIVSARANAAANTTFFQVIADSAIISGQDNINTGANGGVAAVVGGVSDLIPGAVSLVGGAGATNAAGADALVSGGAGAGTGIGGNALIDGGNGATPGWVELRTAASANVTEESQVVVIRNRGTGANGNGGRIEVYVSDPDNGGTADPNGAVTARSGSVWFENPSGGSSGRMFYNSSTGASGNTWTEVGSGGGATFTTPIDPVYLNPPNTPNAADDEFPAGAIDPKWSTFDPGGFLVAPSPDITSFGGLRLITQGTQHIAGIYQPKPSDLYTMFAFVNISSFNNGVQGINLAVTGDIATAPTTEGFYLIGLRTNVGGQDDTQMVGGFKSAYDASTLGAFTNVKSAGWMWMRVRVDLGSNTANTDWSSDGVHWSESAFTGGLAANTNGDYVGLFVEDSLNFLDITVSARCFRVRDGTNSYLNNPVPSSLFGD